MNTEVFFTRMTGADRQRWLARTERELSEAKARLATCRREGSSTTGAEISLQALTERKAYLVKNLRSVDLRPSVSATSAAQPLERRAQVEAWAKKERQAWEQRVFAEAKARQERDERLRNTEWF